MFIFKSECREYGDEDMISLSTPQSREKSSCLQSIPLNKQLLKTCSVPNTAGIRYIEIKKHTISAPWKFTWSLIGQISSSGLLYICKVTVTHCYSLQIIDFFPFLHIVYYIQMLQHLLAWQITNSDYSDQATQGATGFWHCVLPDPS